MLIILIIIIIILLLLKNYFVKKNSKNSNEILHEDTKKDYLLKEYKNNIIFNDYEEINEIEIIEEEINKN